MDFGLEGFGILGVAKAFPGSGLGLWASRFWKGFRV